MNLTAFKTIWIRFYNKLLELNFYSKPLDDIQATQKGRLATRLYIIIFFCAVIVLTFYSSLRYNTETLTISRPSFKKFLFLERSITERLVCPCTNIAISQSSIISFAPEFHQLCSSDFLEENWFDYLNFIQATTINGLADWRWGILPKFRFLQAMCHLAQSTVTEAVNTFGRSKLVTAIALTPVEFSSQASVVITTMTEDTAISFIRAIDLIIINKRYEQLSNMYGTNSYITTYNGIVGVYPSVYNNGTCKCDSQFTCTEQIMFQVNNTSIPVQGWYIGCYMIDSLLDSTLECYYNESCIDLIFETFPTVNYMGDSWNTSRPYPNVLNISRAQLSRFPVNSTVRDCLKEIFVNQWNFQTNFTSYYNECNPTQCSYTLNIRKDLLVVVTTLIGLLGGLSAALNLSAPVAARILYDIIPVYSRYVQNKIGLRARMPINRVSVVS